MRKALAALAAVLLLAACNSTPSPSPSESASATPTATPSPMAMGCTYPADVAAVIGTPAATATVADFVPLNADGAPDATLLPDGYVSPFAGQKFFFAPATDADEWRAGRDVDENPTALGNFTAGSAGGLVNSAIVLPTADGALSNLDTGTVIGELGVRMDNFDDVFPILTGGTLDGLFAAPTAGGYARIGGIAVGADTLYLEFISSWINTLASETAMPADFPILAIAHHPSAASAEAAVAWTKALGSAAASISFCVDGMMTDFAVVSPVQIGIAEADLATRAQTAGGVDLSLAIAAVEADGQHYVIARALSLGDDGVLGVAAPFTSPEFQLAVWPSGVKK